MMANLATTAPILLSAVWETLKLAAATIAGALSLGFLLAQVSLQGGRIGAGAVQIITQLVRGTPVLVFVFLVYYLLPVVGIRLDKTSTAIVSLSVFFSVFFSETFRSAAAAIAYGQRQSGLAMGMSRWEVERIVVLPQAFRIALPPMMNLSAIVVKSTSIVSIIGAWELTYATNELVMRTMQPFQYLLIAMGVYFCICYSLVHLGKHLGRRLSVSQKDA
jgi:His/Glu/Gln/Arg/opine family amino acid ABC transporter permease subunit